MDNTQSTLYTDSGIILQNSDSVLPTNLVVSDASGKRTSVTIEGDLYVAGEIKAGDNDNIPEVNTANSGYLLSNDGSNAMWTNGPIGLGTAGPATPMLSFGSPIHGFAEAWTAGGGAVGVSAIVNGAIVCTFQTGGVRLPGGNPIRSNGNAQSRFQFTGDVPNMQNSVTTGTVGVDRIVNVASANWASTSLDLVCSNTNDTPGSLNASSMGIEVKQNQIVFNGAGTTASATLPTRVNRMTIDNTQVAVSVPLSCTGNISFTGNNGQMRRTDNVNINLYEEGFTRQLSLNVGSNPATRRRLFINDNVVTVENSRFVVSESSQIHSIAGQLNLNTVGSSTAPALLFGDTTGPSGIYGSDNVINFCTDGTERMRIGQNFNDHYQAVTTNQRFQSPDGDGNGYRFANSGDNRIVCNTNTVSIRSNGVNTLSVTNTGATVDGNLTVTGRATIPDVVYPFDVFTSSGSTADFTLAQSTRSNVRLEMDTFNTILRFPALVEGTFYRIVPFRNGTTATLSFRPANNVIMYMYSGGSRSQVTGNAGGTNGHSVLPGTFYECIFSSGSWYVVAQHPIANCTLPADVSIGGNLVVTGTISGNISTPQVAKKTVVIASDSSTAYVYDSGNTAPATTLISVSISSQKNITLGNMGQSYDGFEFEFMLLGDLNNFGVAVTLSLAGSFVKVRSGAIGIVGSTAGQVHTFSRPMNEFRITGVFVWNNGTPYWVVVDRGVYKQRATNAKFTGGTYTVDRNTPEDVLLTRASATTIDFKNLVNEPGFQEDYNGFNFWLSFTNGTSNNVSFTNSAPVGGSSLLIIGNSGAQTISPGSTTVVVASGQTSTCLRCVFRDTAPGGFGWFVYGR
jgi:hypothetical protein